MHAPPRLLVTATLCFLAPIVHASGALPSRGAQERADDFELHGFSLYDTQAAKARAKEAMEHLAAGRWNEALVDLQRLIEDHRGEVLGATRPKAGGRKSQQDVHEGAARHALRQLFDLPPEIKELYRERYGERAARALQAAVSEENRAALTSIARRWPITREAEQSFWALGDLEVELGNLDDGVRAWKLAVSRTLGRPDLELDTADDWRAAIDELEALRAAQAGDSEELGRINAGARARLQLVLDLLGDGGSTLLGQGLRRTPGGTALSSRPVAGGAPGRSLDSWSEDVDLPWHPFRSTFGSFVLYPVRFDDTIFVSTTIEVMAVGAYSGEVLWRSGEQLAGWERANSPKYKNYFEAVDVHGSLVSAAASQGVVVAALQIPQSFQRKIDYGDLSIIKEIPDRRLFAFDAENGQMLWNTMPPARWDGESGSFSDRMSIVGSPVIIGSRVLVPAARLRGRIEYHVGCFDLHTGEVLWSTALITGQRELNMFGNVVTEYSAPPIVVDGERVLALTQLGTLAALDLFAGDILWEVLYDQIPIQPSHHYRAGTRLTKWDNSPPCVAGSTVIATPNDSYDMIAVDLATGCLIWSMDHGLVNQKAPPSSRLDLLIGADEKHVYLAGQRVVSLLSREGIAKAEPIRREWAFPSSSNPLAAGLPRPVLGEERIFVPDSSGLETISRRDGTREQELSWGTGGAGSLLIGDGMVFTLSVRKLAGYFEWDRLIERARISWRDGNDIDSGLRLAVLLEKHGIAEWQGGNSRLAGTYLQEARVVLEELLRRGREETHPGVLAELHASLRAEARVLKDLAESDKALTLLRRARDLSPTPEDLRDTLLEELALLRGRDSDTWLGVLDELLANCGSLRLYCEAQSDADPARPWRGVLQPIVGSSGREGAATLEIPVGLWVLFERAGAHAALGRSAEEFADLHAILERFGHEPIGARRAREWAATRIAIKLRTGDDAGYAVFERSAREQLDEALSTGDRSKLERISEFFPHSKASRVANDARLTWAVESGEVDSVARIVLDELPDAWHPRDANEREVRHLLRLALAFGDVGNPRLRGGLARSLARWHPDLRSDLPGSEGVRLADLAQSWTADDARAPAPEPTFDHEVHFLKAFAGSFELLGTLDAQPGGPPRTLLYADRRRLYAFAEGPGDPERPPGDPAWKVQLQGIDTPDFWSGRLVGVDGRVHLATHGRVMTLDGRTGEELWTWHARGLGLESLTETEGVLVAVQDLSPGDRKELLLIGLDAATGTKLWQREVRWSAYALPPICGEGRCVVMPRLPSREGESIDVFTGRTLARFNVDTMQEKSVDASWIEDGKIIVPRFMEGNRAPLNHIFALDLENGREAWRVDFGRGHLGGRELQSVVAHDGRTYLVMFPGPKGTARRGAIFELNPRIGSVSSSPIVDLRVEDLVIGLPRLQRTEIDSPFLFLRTEPRVNQNYSARAIHLPYGPRWEAVLPVTIDGLYTTSSMPLPALSDSTVVLGWRERKLSAAGQNFSTVVVYVDRVRGAIRDTRILSEAVGGRGDVTFTPLGDALLICGDKQLEVYQ